MLYYTESNGKLPHLFIPVKLQPWFLSLRLKTCLWAELQPWCLSLRRKTCPWAEHSDDDDDDILIFIGWFISLLKYWCAHLIKWATSRHCDILSFIIYFSGSRVCTLTAYLQQSVPPSGERISYRRTSVRLNTSTDINYHFSSFEC